MATDFDRLTSALEEAARAMGGLLDLGERLIKAIEGQSQAADRATGGGFGGQPKGDLSPVGGTENAQPGLAGQAAALSGAGNLLRRFVPAALAAGGANAIGAGAISAIRTGDLELGAASGRASINALAAEIPVFGELSGAAPAERIADDVSRGVLGALDAAARAGAQFSDEDLDAIIDFNTQQAERSEALRQRVQPRVDRISGGTAISRFGFSLTLPGLIANVNDLNDLINGENARTINKQGDKSGLGSFM